jgi:hypothetical protein
LKWTLGGPPAVVDPDALDADEMRVRKGKPTLVDWLSLADEQADREPAAVVDADEDRDEPEALSAPPDPPLRTVLAWAIQELAEAQTALRTQRLPPPNPVAGWEAFAASRLEWDAQAAVEVDLLYMAYAKWCASRGELALEEAKVVAALQAHGASLRTGALTQTAMVQGVRVTA